MHHSPSMSQLQEECRQKTPKASCDVDDPETGLWQRGVALPNDKPPES